MCLTRIAWISPIEQDIDGVRFVGALRSFDVTRMHPHPPGYPVLIAPAMALHRALGLAPGLALSLVSALSLGLLAAMLVRLALQCTLDRPRAVLAALVATSGTAVTAYALRPASDVLGLALAITALSLAAERTLRAALLSLVTLALLAGARPALALFALPIACVALYTAHIHRALARAIAVFLLGFSAWLLPLCASQGARTLLSATLAHARGHFTTYGGTIATEAGPARRALALAQATFAHGLSAHSASQNTATIITATLLCVCALWGLGALASRSFAGRLLTTCTALYALWAWLAQNVMWSPRHALPLLACLALSALGVGQNLSALKRTWSVILLGALLVLPMSIESLRVAHIQRTQPSAPRCMARALTALAHPRTDLIVSTQMPQWLRYLTPELRIRYTPDLASAQRMAQQNHWRLIVSSDVAGSIDAPGARVIARCKSDPRVWPMLNDLAWIALP